MLTGPPRIDDVPVQVASYARPVDARWVDESVYVDVREDDGQTGRVLRESRWRLVGELAWEALSEADLRQMQALLSRPFWLTPRSRRAGDPPSPELRVLCRQLGELQETAPLYARAPDGRALYRLELRWESVRTWPAPLGALAGGLVYEADDAHSVTVSPWGAAQMTPQPLAVVFGGVVYEAADAVLELTPETVAEAVLLADPLDASVLLLDAINRIQLRPGSSTLLVTDASGAVLRDAAGAALAVGVPPAPAAPA